MARPKHKPTCSLPIGWRSHPAIKRGTTCLYLNTCVRIAATDSKRSCRDTTVLPTVLTATANVSKSNCRFSPSLGAAVAANRQAKALAAAAAEPPNPACAGWICERIVVEERPTPLLFKEGWTRPVTNTSRSHLIRERTGWLRRNRAALLVEKSEASQRL